MTRLLLSLTVAAGLAAGTVACGNDPGPAEQAGREIDAATAEMGKQMEQAAKDIGDAVDEAAADASKQLEEAAGEE